MGGVILVRKVDEYVLVDFWSLNSDNVIEVRLDPDQALDLRNQLGDLLDTAVGS